MFAPAEGATRPQYSAGPKGGSDNTLLWECPASVVTTEIWDLLLLWWNCRLMKCLPAAGGFLDQSRTVRDSFPIFEGQYRIVEQLRGEHGAMSAAQMAVVGLMTAMKR